MEALSDVQLFGIPAITLIIWFAAGLAAGTLLMGKRPIGLLGDMLIGVVGGFVGGALMRRFDINLADYIGGVDQPLRGYLGDFFTALIGAVLVLLILRLLIRRR